MEVVRQADITFVCFGAKPNKGLSPRSRRDRKWVRERERSWTKELGEGSWRRVTRVASRQRTAEIPVREDRSRWVGIPRSLVEISLEIHASVSLHMHKGMQCYITPLLHFELTQALLFVCSLSSHSLDCISCSYEEMYDAPIGTTS